ncbi:thiamine pyrophosphate-binding protein [Sedimentibacter sp. zth1]|uniref:thiamine pyrophosphate-binding protein n=1 Tax=Sedimentibacter sp. zth1 TaxID=2816908 RepID=UPI001A921FAF|nr:thiamine pyrophosphate-binding protein [Sedimentibacter sp. zth1]QSX07149.1 thiamine pyrophosphate-binding protein [Sedimentibacter sp. zth1]
MKLSDYIMSYLENYGVKDVFLISGGGMMHLLDSVGKSNINVICNFNEQASSICADSYGKFTNKLGVCMLTTGPGSTNAITGISAAYLDSTPVLAISGQCKTQDSARLRGVRQYGAQEVDIISMVKSTTKYAVQITDKNSIRYHLQKAVYLATHRRKGPVWLDIPLDIQSAQVNIEDLYEFYPEKEKLEYTIDKDGFNTSVEKVYELLKNSKRPVFLVGGGVVGAGAKNTIKALIEKLKVPVLNTWRSKDIFEEDYPYYFDSPGIPAKRYSNYILQNSDLLIIIGTRLNAALTAYDEVNFGPNAKKVIVDIDENELNKFKMKFELSIQADASEFIDMMLEKSSEYILPHYDVWIKYCMDIKAKYPLNKEIQPNDNEGFTDGYRFAEKLSSYFTEHDVFVGSSSGRTCGISHMAVKLKKGQRFISSMGLGSMGFVVPSTIASCIASGRHRTIALEGDGSLQHNIQELQLIKNYNLPIKLFVLSNSGYASIYMMQKNNFKSNFTACNEVSGLNFPKVNDVAKTYGLDYYKIENNEQIDGVLKQVMNDERPVLCEVMSSVYFDEIPKSMTIVNKDGTFSSSKLENLYPFLSEQEVKENMLI